MLSIERAPGWVLVTLAPPVNASDMLGAIAGAPAAMRSSVLVDATALRGFQDPTLHALLGHHMAERLRGVPKVAVVAAEDSISYNSERAAQPQRLNVRVFTCRAEAEAWLAR